ncbi:uncharacterized protein PFL1_01805 [Pseudozyma flocculosa PF-1]|uniref:uncharacterized protein n=1 Tax=Pseudozyma flocculosa PF-1 TaxID=1277687 RepID=UPI0004560C39|nr:uncharacterized protein PFL1_01805 [Pseudozyma flocculosa PF-1]EPQ30907.1 hypothetical protein PFL1_01805 [Pseudozyma flocculosa PF-1]
MKVVHSGSSRHSAVTRDPSVDADAAARLALMRGLDDSLHTYYGEPEPAHTAAAASSVSAVEANTAAHPTAGPVAPTSSPPSPPTDTSDPVEPVVQVAPQPLRTAAPSNGTPEAVPDVGVDATAPPADVIGAEQEEYDAATEVRETPLRAAKVPSSRLGRLFHYGSLGAGLAVGTAGQFFRGGGGDSSGGGGMVLSEQNISRLVDKLSTMRGAALKLGQFLSIQDTNVLPPQIEKVLLRVQNAANYMPVWQMQKVMSAELGCSDWKERYFESFDEIPFASASIGQVHSATLRRDFADDPSMAGRRVAVKVQFPGVLESIDSDLSYIRWLVSASALLPRGLFLDNSLKVMSRELRDECDYEREAEMGRKFRALLEGSAEFEVPKVVDALSTRRVLVTEMMRGRPLTQASRYTQEKRDQIARSILNLSLSELFRFRLMQTDPNWTNFLYNERNGKLQLIDFGATREYSKEFMDDWLKMLQAAIRGNHDECVQWSRKVGYLTGEESERMERAHVDSMIALGEPFRDGSPDPYPFESQTITDRVKAQIPLMLKERLTPPPEETYSLNRKLSGAFLLCARLKARVSCRGLFKSIEQEYQFGPVASPPSAAVVQGVRAASAPSMPDGRREFHTSRIVREARRVLEQREAGGAGGAAGSGDTGPASLGAELRKTIGSRDRPRPARRHGINLNDRFPRSRIVAPVETEGTVTSLSPGFAAGSFVETGSDANAEAGGVDLGRKVLPAEVTPSRAESPMTARQDTVESDSASPPLPPVEGADEAECKPMGPTVIRGITIPLKPPPPGPDECCMSGCAHCAYDIYAEDLEDFHSRLQDVRARLAALQPPVAADEWREDLLGSFPSSDPGAESGTGPSGGEDVKAKAEREVDQVIGDLDPTMKAFLEMERRMKKKERAKAAQ